MTEISLKTQSKIYDFYIYLSYFVLILSFFGISFFSPTYIDFFQNFIKLYISLFLIWRFNPLRTKQHFTDLDRKIAFSSGTFLLTTSILNKYIVLFTNYSLAWLRSI
jgi:hypothetical protein